MCPYRILLYVCPYTTIQHAQEDAAALAAQDAAVKYGGECVRLLALTHTQTQTHNHVLTRTHTYTHTHTTYVPKEALI
jgi:hypothetical protein